MIAFRSAHPALAKGEMEITSHDAGGIAFIRTHGDARIYCAFNLSNQGRPVELPEGEWVRDRGAPFKVIEQERGHMLPPYQAFFAVAETDG